MIVNSEISCCSCGIEFSVSTQYHEQLRRDGRTFWCPNGHRQSYTESEVDRLGKALAKEKSRSKDLSLIAAGICPICKTSLTNLTRHMTKLHPVYIEKNTGKS